MNWFEHKLIKASKECTGISIWLTSNEELKIRLTVLSRIGKSLKIVRTDSFDNIASAIEQIPLRSPVVISVDGYGIIHKSVKPEESENGIANILPNARLSDLYIQRIDQDGKGDVIFSIARKEKINEIISLLNTAGFYPFNLILGPFGILNLLPLMPSEEEIKVPLYRFEVHNGVIASFKKEEHETPLHNINFGNEDISSEYLLPLCCCLDFFMQYNAIHNNIVILETQRKEFLSKRTIQYSGLIILMLVFCSLLINFSLFTRYRSENQILEQKIRSGKELIQETDSLKIIIKDKKALAQTDNDKSVKLFAYYADRIASVIPSSVKLGRVCIYPPEKSYRNANKYAFKKEKISVSGYLNMSVSLDQMIKRFSSFGWVKEVKIINYQDQVGDPASFELEIEIQ